MFMCRPVIGKKSPTIPPSPSTIGADIYLSLDLTLVAKAAWLAQLSSKNGCVIFINTSYLVSAKYSHTLTT